jgi:hypothetical protein
MNSHNFTIQLRSANGEKLCLSASDASAINQIDNDVIFTGFVEGISVVATATPISSTETEWSITIDNPSDYAIEWVDYPCVKCGKLKRNGGDAQILSSYNEGIIIEDAFARDTSSPFPQKQVEYPSEGAYYMFPHMLSAQFIAYLAPAGNIYLGAHDPARGPKSIDYRATEEGVELFVKTFTGVSYGENYSLTYPIITKNFEGDWEDAATIYRDWFEANLPAGAVKIPLNSRLPQWYEDSPLIIAYPVRGIHDMDEMTPNALFPYMQAMPIIEEIARETQTRIMVLLMHWEGTAPWAPPYVWPPYGGEESFNEFLNKLHEKGHLLGVYCSGFGWTEQSNLIAEYARSAEKEGLLDAMCAGPDGKVLLSKICTFQRSGYDICPASEKGRKILREAYSPLFSSGVDYAQILDQNHGGAQYFCYSREHGHPAMPGSWMTSNMQTLLTEWNRLAPSMLMGCESAAAEPFTPNLLFSDNRFELNYYFGRPVPLYAFIYHEYLRNFMGNQVSCPFPVKDGTLCMRMAHSFVAGDALTVTLMPNGEFMPNWGCRDFSVLPDKKTHLAFIKRLMEFYRGPAKQFLFAGRMVKPLPVKCPTISVTTIFGYTQELPAVFSTAWEANGERAQIFVNHTENDAVCTWNGETITIPALNAVIKEI